jgi:hypothetical protein
MVLLCVLVMTPAPIGFTLRVMNPLELISFRWL